VGPATSTPFPFPCFLFLNRITREIPSQVHSRAASPACGVSGKRGYGRFPVKRGAGVLGVVRLCAGGRGADELGRGRRRHGRARCAGVSRSPASLAPVVSQSGAARAGSAGLGAGTAQASSAVAGAARPDLRRARLGRVFGQALRRAARPSSSGELCGHLPRCARPLELETPLRQE
jgi:hypothetical protein